MKYLVHPYYLSNPEMALAAEAAWCAHDQGKYFEYERMLYQRQGAVSYTQEGLTGLAEELALDAGTFSDCLSKRKHRADLESSTRDAMRRGVNSTPTFYINNQQLKGNYPYQEFQRIIEAKLASGK